MPALRSSSSDSSLIWSKLVVGRQVSMRKRKREVRKEGFSLLFVENEVELPGKGMVHWYFPFLVRNAESDLDDLRVPYALSDHLELEVLCKREVLGESGWGEGVCYGNVHVR